MMLFVILGILTILIVAYVMEGRAWLKRQAWSARFFSAAEPFEIVLWRKSETILWARFLQGLGLLLTLLSSLGQFDLAPVMPLVSDRYPWLPPMLPLIISMTGAMNESLRRYTTKPLELVEVPDVAPPMVAAAVARAEVSKDVAVAAVATDAEEKKVSGYTS